jgi:hypothetical protein
MNCGLALENYLQLIQQVIQATFSEDEKIIIMDFVAEILLEIYNPPIKSFVAESDHQLVMFPSVKFSSVRTSISVDIFLPQLLYPLSIRKKVSAQPSLRSG